MSLQDRLRAGAASFAHLAGVGRTPVSARADDDDDRREEARAEDEDDKRDDDDKPDGKKSGSRAEDDDDKKDDDDKPDSKKGRRAEDEDDDEGDDDFDKKEMRGRSSVASARARERARCASIFLSRHAAGNPAMAAQLAFATTLSRKEAVAVLASAPRNAPGNSGREARNPDLGPGGERGATSAHAVEASWARAFAKATDPLGARRRSA